MTEAIWHIDKESECVQTLIENDAQLAKYIEEIGSIDVQIRTHSLASLVRSIVGQQISVSAALAIYGRLSEAINDEWRPENLRALTEVQMKTIGLTQRKQTYIHDLTDSLLSGELDFEALEKLDNESVIETLTKVKGIGRWTAEVFLILTLKRHGVLPLKDVGLQRAAQWVRGGDMDRMDALMACKDLWGNCSTIGALYLWEIKQHYKL